jgi:aspartate/methionine/tyrosine aminotransferase
VVVTPGAKPNLFFPLAALLEPGDEVLYPNPGFPIYESVIRFCRATPVPMPLVEDRGFSLDLDLLRDKLSPKTKLLILNSPQNPTGGTIPEADLREIAAMVLERDMMVLSDEIYSEICFDEKPFSISSIEGMVDRTIILDGFSKTYSMTGWRMGYAAMPKWLVDAVCLLMVNCVSHTASFTQRAGIAALTGPQDCVTEMVAEFKRRRDVITAGFNRIPGFRCNLPGGAFYSFPNITGTGIPSGELANRVLNEAGVACLSGTSFGAYGEGYLRFSYVTALSQIEEALNRIEKMRKGISG